MTFGPSDIIVCPTWWDRFAVLLSVCWLIFALAVLWEHRRAVSSSLVLSLALPSLLVGSAAAWLNIRGTVTGIRLVAHPTRAAIAQGLAGSHSALQLACSCAAVLTAAALPAGRTVPADPLEPRFPARVRACLGMLTASLVASTGMVLTLARQPTIRASWLASACLVMALAMAAAALLSVARLQLEDSLLRDRSRLVELALLIGAAALAVLLGRLENHLLLDVY